MYISIDSLPSDLNQLAEAVKQAAQVRQGDCIGLLQLLRLLEDLHRSIYDSDFQAALPSTRQDLHELLVEIEEAGSWPYMPRMQIHRLIQNLTIADQILISRADQSPLVPAAPNIEDDPLSYGDHVYPTS